MKKVNLIAFSKDRACQLDAALHSALKHAPWMWPPKILYASSSPEYEQAYRMTATTWNVGLEWQIPLKEKILAAIDPDVPLTAFMVDDALFFRDFPEVCPPAGRAFAPRLGKNCTYCYAVDKPQKEGELDFAYFFSIDCTVYRTKDLLPRIEAADFSTPNQFEDVLSRGAPISLDYAEHSSLVGIPHNKVGEYANRHGGGSNKELNDKYVCGARIDPDRMDFSNVIGSHQEIPYVWR